MGVAKVGREVFLRAVLKTETVDVPEWGGPILLRELSAAQVVEFVRMNRAQADTDPGADMHRAAWTVIACWVDEAGDPILTEDDMAMLLATQPASLINRISVRAAVLSGMLPRELAADAKAPDPVAVAEKNSESSQGLEPGTP